MYGSITLGEQQELGVCKTFNAPGLNKNLYNKYKDEIKGDYEKKSVKV